MLDRIEFLFSEAFVALRRHGLMTFAAISTAAVALFLIGGVGYVYYRVQSYAETLPSRFDMRVFLREGVKSPKISETAKKIRAINGVQAVVWIPKEKAWEKEKKERPDLTVGLENPFPDALKVTLKDLSKTDAVVSQIQALTTVDPNGIEYFGNEQRFLGDLLKMLRVVGLLIGGLLFLTAGMLIYNAIQLAVVARRREIRVMEMVGATGFTIRTPFCIEGMVQGALGGVVATMLIWIADWGFRSVQLRYTATAAETPFPVWSLMLILGITGGVFGWICSLLALRVPLRSL